MRTFRPSIRRTIRRTISVAVAVLAGAAATLAFASPASAHHTAIAGDARCDTASGQWVVAWTVRSESTPPQATQFKLVYVQVQPAGSDVTGLPVDTFQDIATPFTGEQRLPGDATSATLSVRGRWNNNFEEKQVRTKTIEFGGGCQEDQPKPNASFASACDGTVTVTLTNDADATKDAEFTVTGAGGFEENKTVAPGDSAEVVVPAASASAVKVTVGKGTIGEYSWAQPEDCAPLTIVARSDCDSLTIVLENPDGNREITATVTSGDASEELSVAPGESKEVTFPASDGTTATVLIAGENEPVTVTWEQPENCDSPDLPVTGANVGGVIGLGALLIAFGAAVIVVLRRRRAVNTL